MHARLGDALVTDLYQLTMLQGYFAGSMQEEAVFELFVRKLAPDRGFLIAAGIEQAVQFLEGLAFSEAELDALGALGQFRPEFLACLRDLRFRGDVDALPEGTLAFEDEPIVRVTAALPEAQLVETRLLNIVHLQTVLASKAARMVLTAPESVLIDFGARRAHGKEAGCLAARAAYLAGFDGTSTVLAGIEFGIPLYGTMAHSFVEAHDSEREAFVAFARANPGHVVLLIDTYDTEEGAKTAVLAAEELAAEGIRVSGVRIDSGDLAEHARHVRHILDAGGLTDCRIVVSGGLDEWKIRDLVRSGAPIDGFAVGSRLTTSGDMPFLDCAYKLQEYRGRARRKRSTGKATWPGRKQVFRRFAADGTLEGDTVALADESPPGEPLLVPFMREGRLVRPAEPLTAARARARHQLSILPERFRALEGAPRFPVTISPSLRDLAERLDACAMGGDRPQ